MPEHDLQHHLINNLICTSWNTGRQLKNIQMYLFILFFSLRNFSISLILTGSEHSICLHFAQEISDMTKHSIHMPNGKNNDRNAKIFKLCSAVFMSNL